MWACRGQGVCLAPEQPEKPPTLCLQPGRSSWAGESPDVPGGDRCVGGQWLPDPTLSQGDQGLKAPRMRVGFPSSLCPGLLSDPGWSLPLSEL